MVCIILINYNGKVDTEECVKSIKKNLADFKIIIVDNNSTTGRVEYNDVIDEKSCEIIYLDDNIGFAAGNNVGLQRAKELNPEYYFILNNDTIIADDCLEKLISKSQKESDRYVITTKIVYFDEPGMIWYGGCSYNKNAGEYKSLGFRQNDSEEYNIESEVDYITGCAMFIPAHILDTVGFMSEEYFLYYEDADYCERIKKASARMLYYPDVTILHKESRSTKRGSDMYNYYIIRNYLFFISKYSERKIYYLLNKLVLSYKEVFRGRLKSDIWKMAWKDFIHKSIGKKQGAF